MWSHFSLGVIWSNSGPHQPKRRGQPLQYVNSCIIVPLDKLQKRRGNGMCVTSGENAIECWRQTTMCLVCYRKSPSMTEAVPHGPVLICIIDCLSAVQSGEPVNTHASWSKCYCSFMIFFIPYLFNSVETSWSTPNDAEFQTHFLQMSLGWWIFWCF